jgi:hypothetical protein
MTSMFMRLAGVVFICLICFNYLTAQVPFANPGHEGLNTTKIGNLQVDSLNTLNFGLWIQNRVMYNYSNIPGPTGTSFENLRNYDFFRQRFRVGIDINLSDTTKTKRVGTYFQLEYRGGWGGSSPIVSDPRNLKPINNPYNRLKSHGVRYGFVYYDYKKIFNLSAGILPLTDQFGRTLFDSDWDFSVGGITISGNNALHDYRIAYIRYIDGIGNTELNFKNTDFFLGDYNLSIGSATQIGIHAYYLNINQNNDSTALIITRTEGWAPQSEAWFGLTAKTEINKTLALNGFVLLNSGKNSEASHTGLAINVEGILSVKKSRISLKSIYTTGDKSNEVKNRFITPTELFRTAGFWGYTHIFTANGPSDVNDLGLEIGNSGAGLFSFQAKLDFPIYSEKINGQLAAAWFQASESRNQSKNMGIETSAMINYVFLKYFSLDLGMAYADMGGFYSMEGKNLFEVFSRLQFTW